MNCDAIVGDKFSCIAVVVRDWRGKLVFAHSKKVYTKVFVQAKAKAILSKVVRPGLRTSVEMG